MLKFSVYCITTNSNTLSLFCSTIHEYYSKNNALPEFINKSQVDEIVKRKKRNIDNNSKLSKEGKLNWFVGVQEWDEKFHLL